MTTDLDRRPSGDESSGNQDRGRRGKLASATDKVRKSAGDTYGAARERTGALYDTARQKASSAYESTRESASRARQKTAQGIDDNPIAAVVGALAAGALVAAMLPRTRREAAALGPIGSRITGKLDELGISKEGARQKLSEVTSNASEAVRSAASAAAKAAAGSRED